MKDAVGQMMRPSEKCAPRYSDHHYDDSSYDDEDRFSQAPSDNPRRSTVSNLTIHTAIAQEDHAATDIVVVVLATPTRQDAPALKFASQQSNKFNILIGDATIPHGKCARMSLPVTSRSVASLLDGKEGMGMITPMKNDSNDSTENAFNLGMLKPGDVVRFNNVEMHKHYESSDSTTNSSSGKRKHDSISIGENDQTTPLLKSIICDLRTSYKVPCGLPLARICRIIPKSTSSLEESSPYHLQWERNVPLGFETSKDVVVDLARYYCKYTKLRQLSDTSILPTNQSCQRRRIRDINTDNMASHVLVMVLRCEVAKSLFSTPSKSPTEPMISHATLSDGKGNDDMIGLAASASLERVAGRSPVLPKGISATLLQAMAEGKYVLLTNVSSRSLNPVATGKEYLGLVPTVETTATIIKPDHPYYVTPEAPRRSEIDPYASQPLTLERASQLLSLTQHDSPEKRDARCLMAIESPLKDIFVDGISASLVEGAYWDKPRALSNFLINRPSISTGLDAIKLQPSYRSATLLLDPKFVSREIVVSADGNALKLLCMDVPIEDMIIEDDCMDASTHPYLLHVGRMLKSLCEEDVRIRWVLEQEDECNWFVTNATLLKI